jgi:hypothetical protein
MYKKAVDSLDAPSTIAIYSWSDLFGDTGARALMEVGAPDRPGCAHARD